MTFRTEPVWRGCYVATRNASWFHDAHDFAALTLCGLRLSAGTGLSEGHVTSAMRECLSCAASAPGHAGHTADDCPGRQQAMTPS
jgi:hypothetical protein